MPKLFLTAMAVERLKSTTQQVTYWDTSLRGFGIRVGRAKKTWTVMRGASRERISFAQYPDMRLTDARKKAMALLSTEPTQTNRTTFGQAVELFLENQSQRNKPKTVYETERLLRRHFLPKLAKRPLADISTLEVVSILDTLLRTPFEANAAFTAARQFFRWLAMRGYCGNPLAGHSLPAKTASRDRVLSDQELKTVWFAAGENTSFHKIVRLCVLTGQRRSEIAGFRPQFIDKKSRTITLPETKNGRPHTFPYGEMAAELLTDLPFSSFSWSPAKKELDAKCGIRDWTLHDLRRTFATNLAALAVPPQITERLLNHVSGTISGIAAIYNRHAYMDEMRAAVIAYEQHLSRLLSAAS